MYHVSARGCGLPHQCLAIADALPSSACHCEERSDVAIRSPAVAQSKEQYLRQTRKSVYEFARSSASLSSFTAGMRIATPVCALVRNDMLKTERRLRLQGRGARKVCRRQGVSTGARTSPPVIARSEATGQSVAVGRNEKQLFPANAQPLANLPGRAGAQPTAGQTMGACRLF